MSKAEQGLFNAIAQMPEHNMFPKTTRRDCSTAEKSTIVHLVYKSLEELL
jgi:hypothetical protein